MSEEEKKDAQTEKPVEAGSAETSETTEDKAPEKNKKIKFMSIKELDEAIENTKKNQGGLYSKYAKELIKRKNFLSNNTK